MNDLTKQRGDVGRQKSQPLSIKCGGARLRVSEGWECDGRVRPRPPSPAALPWEPSAAECGRQEDELLELPRLSGQPCVPEPLSKPTRLLRNLDERQQVTGLPLLPKAPPWRRLAPGRSRCGVRCCIRQVGAPADLSRFNDLALREKGKRRLRRCRRPRRCPPGAAPPPPTAPGYSCPL